MKIKQVRGFTLLEVIIYLALFAILMAGFLTAAFTLIESSGKDTTASVVQAEGSYLLAKIHWALQNNDTQIDPATLVSANMQLSNFLYTQLADGSGTDVGVRFTLSMRSGEGRLVSEDFFSTTTISQ
jgi:prepilin-type N-terminal cleavage/methylation domain-containing protein